MIFKNEPMFKSEAIEELHQKAYNQVKEHLLKQNSKSTTVSGHACVYRSEDGKKCAIGALIPDREYDEELETMCLGFVQERVKSLSKLNYEFLQELQVIHDSTLPTDWDFQLRRFAVYYGLEP